jgi:hypothetical protein
MSTLFCHDDVIHQHCATPGTHAEIFYALLPPPLLPLLLSANVIPLCVRVCVTC